MGNINYNKIYREALRKAAIELEERSIEFQRRLEDQAVNLGVISSSRAGRNFVPEIQDEAPSETYHLNFDGENDKIVIPHAASIDNLPLSDFTVEISGTFLDKANQGILNKVDVTYSNGWEVYLGHGDDLQFDVFADDYNEYKVNYYDALSLYGVKHHYEFTYNAATKEIKLFIDGVFQTPASTDDLLITYTGEGNSNLGIGGYGGWVDTDNLYYSNEVLRWVRISTGIRHTSGFTPPSLVVCPDSDANTVLLLALDEGTGTLAHDTSENENDGVISGAIWELDTPDELNTFESIAFDSESFE